MGYKMSLSGVQKHDYFLSVIIETTITSTNRSFIN